MRRPKAKSCRSGRDQVGAASVAARFHGLRQRPEFEFGAAMCLGGRDAGRDQGFGVCRDVSAEFSVHVGFGAGSVAGGAPPGTQAGEDGHISSAVVLENARHEAGHLAPFISFGAKLTAAGGGQPIVLSLALVVRFAPFAGYEALVPRR